MTAKDTITLPREVVEQLLKMLEMVEPYADQFTDYSSTASEWPLNLLPKKVSEAITALRTHLTAEPTKPVVISKDWLKMTLRVNRGDRVLKVERWLHLSEIKQSRFPLVKATADSAWQELDAAMKEDKT